MAHSSAQVVPIDLCNWMSNLSAEVSRQPLNWLAIPGSHDSFTSAISRYSVASPDGDAYHLVRRMPQCMAGSILPRWTVTQSVDVIDQLQGGIRYFDLRVCVRKAGTKHSTANVDEFILVHGQYATPVAKELPKIVQFLRDHPREVILLDFNHRYEFQTEEHLLNFEKLVCDILGPMLYPFKPQIPSLDAVWESGKSILFFSCMRAQGNDKFWPGSRMVSLWPETSHVNKMIQFLDQHYGPSYNRKANTFYVHQGVLTPDSSYIVRHSLGSVRRLAKSAGQAFQQWLRAPKRMAGAHGVNVTLLDFVVSDFPDYAHTVILLNYKTWPLTPQ
ncbi:PLC phosphodiesterase TIM beta alpha barrel domain [Paragonimus heterotremus]|uniref:PLC phosphodiesterase TIM beta alpha barrel domain n=1 Tax=Paragonimus heterotremus TaxID=100268 RepID=A0A8J4TNH5_9TREM|nr:PLC phosphodiesterase TIM beta alpha barrel domain [Paragonimus heterotremus]